MSSLCIEINVCAGDAVRDERFHRVLMQERVAGTLAFQKQDAALYEPIRQLINRRLRRPEWFTAGDQGRLDGLVEARRTLWEYR